MDRQHSVAKLQRRVEFVLPDVRSSAIVASKVQLKAMSRPPVLVPPAGGERSPNAVRDQLYRDNQRHRETPVKLAPGEWDETTPVSVLGLEQPTISRLYRVGIDRLSQLLSAPVEDLWRNIGRHGVADIMKQLEFQGLALKASNDYERWRLGLVQPQQIELRVTPETPVTDLWPRLGFALTELLQKRGRVRISDLAPRDQEDLVQLYRLGKGNLRKIQSILEQIAPQAEGAWRDRIDVALGLIRGRSKTRISSLRGFAVRGRLE